VLTAVVTRGLAIEVTFVAAEEGEGELMSYEESLDFCEFPYESEEEFLAEAEVEHPCLEGPSPLAIETKELAWGAGAFIVLALLMRFWLFPAVKKGMDARYAHIRQGHEQAEAAKQSATGAVADYEAALAGVKAEAAARVDAARRTLEAERTARLAEVNATIAAKREAAAAEAQAAREAVRADIVNAAADVTSRTLELSTGAAPDAAAVRRAVEGAMSTGVAS
jgi:F-type H+-transporting ATPase subunit b